LGMIRTASGLFFSAFFGLGFAALAVITLLPATASKPNPLGYYGVCSFAPASTIILSALSAVFVALGIKMLKRL